MTTTKIPAPVDGPFLPPPSQPSRSRGFWGKVGGAAWRGIGGAASMVFGRRADTSTPPQKKDVTALVPQARTSGVVLQEVDENDNPKGPATTYASGMASQGAQKVLQSRPSQLLKTAARVGAVAAGALLLGAGLYVAAGTSTVAAALDWLSEQTLLPDARALLSTAVGAVASVAASTATTAGRYIPPQVASLLEAYPVATLSAALAVPTGIGALATGRRLLTGPKTESSTPPAETESHSLEVVCNGGKYVGDKFKITIFVPKSSTDAQKRAIVEQFKETVLQNLEGIPVGKDVNIQIRADGWKATLKEDGSTLQDKTLPLETTEPAKRESIELLHDILHGPVEVKRGAFAKLDSGLASILNRPTARPVGFTNNGRICFLNAIMQGLLAVPPMREKMRRHQVLQVVVRNYEAAMARNNGTTLSLKSLFQTPTLQRFRQGEHDTDECCNAILALIGANNLENIGTSTDTSNNTPQYPRINLSPSNFNEWVQGEPKTLLGDGGEFKTFSSPPQFLHLHIGRNLNSLSKDETPVNATRNLRFPQQSLPQNPARPWTQDEQSYELESFTVHTGNTSEGHYVSYRRTVERINGIDQVFYWQIDDAQVFKATRSDFEKAAKQAVDLFYVRKDHAQKPLVVRGSPRVLATEPRTPPAPA